MVIVLVGPMGCGKTTIGHILARQLDWPFYDGDDFHPEANKKKMSEGVALEDSDREPWLKILNGLIQKHLVSGRNMILACSALKKKYRDLIELFVQLNTGGTFPKPVGNKNFDRLNVDKKKKALIYSNIKLYEDSERKKKEFHGCFKNLNSNLIDFFTFFNRKLFP